MVGTYRDYIICVGCSRVAAASKRRHLTVISPVPGARDDRNYGTLTTVLHGISHVSRGPAG